MKTLKGSRDFIGRTVPAYIVQYHAAAVIQKAKCKTQLISDCSEITTQVGLVKCVIYFGKNMHSLLIEERKRKSLIQRQRRITES